MNIGAFLYLRISGNDLDIERISTVLNEIPCQSFKVGEVRNTKYGTVVYKEDCWMSEYIMPENQSFDEAVVQFMQSYLSQREFINALAEKNDITVWGSVYPDENQCNIGLSKSTIRFLHSFGVDFDLTMTFLSDFYEGKINDG